MELITFRNKLRRYIECKSSQAAIAKQCGTYPAMVNGLLQGRNNHKRIIEAAGYEIVLTVRKREGREQWF